MDNLTLSIYVRAQVDAVKFWVLIRNKGFCHDADWYKGCYLNQTAHTSVLTLFPDTLSKGLWWRSTDDVLTSLVKDFTNAMLIQDTQLVEHVRNELSMHYLLNYSHSTKINKDHEL